MVCAKPSRYLDRLPWLAPRKNHSARAWGSSVGSFAYPESLAKSMTVRGRSTPSRCSCNSTFGRLCSNCLSNFIDGSLLVLVYRRQNLARLPVPQKLPPPIGELIVTLPQCPRSTPPDSAGYI